MFEAIATFFSTCNTLFVATNRGAVALDNLAKVAEAESGLMADQAELNRAGKRAELDKLLKRIPKAAKQAA